MKWRVAAALLLLGCTTSAAAAQRPTLRDELNARITDPGLAAQVRRAIATAERAGLPTVPLARKALEGVTKGADAAAIVAALDQVTESLRAGRDIVRSTGATPEVPAVVVAAAQALQERVTRAEIRAVLGVSSDPVLVQRGLVVVTTLTAAGFASRDAATIVTRAIRGERSPEDLLEIPSAATEMLSRGLRRSDVVDRLLAGEGFPSTP